MRIKGRSFLLLIILFALKTGYSKTLSLVPEVPAIGDSTEVLALTKEGYNSRLVDPNQTLQYGLKALELSKRINFTNGVAEAYRVIGIGKFYQNDNEAAIENYLLSLSFFQQSKNQNGIAKVYNNIGNMYRDVDYDKAIFYFSKSLELAKKLKINELIAGISMNNGIVFQKKKNYNLALKYITDSYNMFVKLKNPVGISQALQNFGVIYRYLNRFKESEAYAKKAIELSKENDLNFNVASTNLTLSMIYIAQKRFTEAEKSIQEGIAYSEIIKDKKLLYDYTYTTYLLENKRQNHEKALYYLTQVYKQDSSSYRDDESNRIELLQAQFKARETQRENELTIEKQKVNKIIIWFSVVGSALLLVVILLLVRDGRKKAQNNKQLTALNAEVLLQKENLDRINHNLEDIIEERTKDLKIKNKKLSDYSSHLSHQIRGPIATLKGLMNLERESLIEKEEFVQQIEKCVNDIDDKILNINEMLHDPQKYGFRND